MSETRLDNAATVAVVTAHLLAQNAQATRFDADGNLGCAYRADDGRTCAIGCLLSDEHYSPALEGHAVTTPEVLAALRASGCDASVVVLVALQAIHDVSPPSTWPTELGQV